MIQFVDEVESRITRPAEPEYVFDNVYVVGLLGLTPASVCPDGIVTLTSPDPQI